ncbi:MAG: THUMP-like domain-containing protein [Nocardioidaceae bacterium]
MRAETFERLLTPAGRDLLDEVDAAADESALALGTRLRRTHDADLVAAATQQVRLRRKARVKFGDDAARMYFTPEALQQATRATVAAHRAGRAVAAGVDSALDLTCGIGGDLIALTRAGVRVTGIDLDPVRAHIAGANLAALGLPGNVVCADATIHDRSAAGLSFVDPARRDERGRTFDPRRCAPDWDFVVSLLHAPGAAKVAPGIAHDLVPPGVEAEWVSDAGDLVEACLWGTPLATAARRATLLPSGATLTEADDPVGATAVRAPGRYIYEPDDAVIRAHLVTAVAAEVDGWLLDPHIAYVSGDRLKQSPFATAHEVVDELPYREKPLRAALRARDVGALTVKKRGVDVVPERLIGRLRLRGSTPAMVIMTRVDGAGRAFLVRRV